MRILVPTDGSPQARRAARFAARLARKLGARLTALYVVEEGVPTLFSGRKLFESPALAPQYERRIRAAAERALRALAAEAGRAHVACERLNRRAPHRWQAIVRTARRRRCDLIVMAPEGREAAKVIAHSKIPVLVCR